MNFFVNLVIFAEKPVAALRLSFHDANWWEHTEKKTGSTDAVPTHYVLAGIEVFFYLRPRALEMLRAPRYLNPAL